MRRYLPALCALLFAGCASSSEVKQASGDVDLALAALSEAQEDYRDIFLRELGDTQELVARAIVADAVVRVVESLAVEEIEGNLIVISAAMRIEREAYRDLTAAVMRTRPRADEDPGAVVKRVLERKAADLRAAARALDAAGQTESAAAVRERAERWRDGSELAQYSDLETLAILQIARGDVRRGSDKLGAYVDLMQLVHAQVHEWIATDVTVRGDQVAALIDRHSATLGLSESIDGGPTDPESVEPQSGGTP
jgi:hypothetical protein